MFKYSIPGNHLNRFNATCPENCSLSKYIEDDTEIGQLSIGLFLDKLPYDCTTLLMYGIEYFMMHANTTKRQNTVTTLKRFMYYGNMNTCICTTVLGSVKIFLEEFGFVCVNEIDSSREKSITKYTMMLTVEPKKVGYPCWDLDFVQFDDDPYLKEYV